MGFESGEQMGSQEGKTFISRATLSRIVEGDNYTCANTEADCEVKKNVIKFTAKTKASKVVANIYDQGVWQSTEFYHQECYTMIGEPYGTAMENPIKTQEELEKKLEEERRAAQIGNVATQVA